MNYMMEEIKITITKLNLLINQHNFWHCKEH